MKKKSEYFLNKLSYLEPFIKKPFLIICTIFGLIIIFNIPISKILLIFSKTLFNDLPNHDNVRSSIITIPLILALYHTYKQISKNKYPTIYSCVIIILSTTIYLFYFRYNSDFYFFKWFFPQVYILDIIISSISIWCIHFEILNKPSSVKESYLLEDNSDLIEDRFKRSNFAKSIVKVIEQTNPTKSFSIALLSGWGFGKSTFLKQIEKETRNGKNIVINFNPWKFGNNSNIIQFFFDELSTELGKYNYNITEEIQIYTQKLFENEEGDSLMVKVLKSLIGNTFFQTHSVQEQHDTINRLIAKTGKKVIVLVDDLDRLSGEEIIPILQLIRNIANFHSLIFITAFDRSYVINSLSKIEKITNEQQYLEKIFQLEIPLPPIKTEFINKEILLHLQKFLKQEDLAKINILTNIKLDLTNTTSVKNIGLLLPYFWLCCMAMANHHNLHKKSTGIANFEIAKPPKSPPYGLQCYAKITLFYPS